MALTVPKNTRVCLYCKINSDGNAGKQFHAIFDEVCLELQLPFLVKTIFHIDLNKEDKQHLCDDCVNRLIELYDLNEHAKEESSKTNYLKNKPECSNNETLVSTQGENAVEIQKPSKYEGIDRTECENIEDVGYFFDKNRLAPFAQKNNQSNIDEDLPEEDFDQTYKKKVSQDFDINLSSSAVKDEKSDELESNEHMEFISDDENQSVEINNQSNANIIVGSIQLEIKEQEVSQDSNISLSYSAIKDEKSDELESNEHMEFISDDENQNVEINKQSNSNITANVSKEIDNAKEAYCPNQTHNENDLCVEEVDDHSNQDINIDDSNSLLEELKITEEKEASLLNASGSEEEFYNIDNDDADDLITLEEEDFFIEEPILSEGYDQVDLNEYMDKVLQTKFQDLLLTCEMECKFCLEKFDSFGKLLNHACIAEFEKEQQLSCIIKDCEEHANDLPTLARHLVINHYDKLERTKIDSKCTACQKTFLNVLNFNQHSCCQSIKRKNGLPDFKCEYCDLDIPSFKRFVFHMQFHLKNHRPKICLLCGDLFNNSNDFFEHTQYKHNPETATTCVRCERSFRDIHAFNNHMELNEFCKDKFECARCPKIYSNKLDLNQHMDTFHNEKSNAIQCKYCPKKFEYKASYYYHIKTHDAHAKVRTFICSTCGLIAKNMEMIKDHIESHNESPCFSSPVDQKIVGICYSCENCSLDFCTINDLKDHRLSDSHSDDSFHCGMCRSSFNKFNQMRNHFLRQAECKEMHLSFPISRYYLCNIGDCQKFYRSWNSLCLHKYGVHKTVETTKPPKNLKCQFCEKFYSSKRYLRAHIYGKHNNASTNSQNVLQKHMDKDHTSDECDISSKKSKYDSV